MKVANIINYLVGIIILLPIVSSCDSNRNYGKSDTSFVMDSDKRVPFFKYVTNSRMLNSEGIAVFIEPSKNGRLSIRAIRFDPVFQDYAELLEGDARGTGGYIYNSSIGYSSTAIPLTIPKSLLSSKAWKYVYRSVKYSCSISSSRMYKEDRIFDIICKGGTEFSPHIKYSPMLGVVQFRDTCDSGFCDFVLKDKIGILAKNTEIHTN